MKRYILSLKKSWLQLISLGQGHVVSPREKKFIKFTNIVAALTAMAVFLYIPFSFIKGNYLLGIEQTIDGLCVLTVLWFNYAGYNIIARHVYILIINVFVLINSCIIGHESSVQDFFYIAYIVPFLLFNVKDYKNIILGVSFSIICFYIYQYVYPHFVRYNLDIETQHQISNINLWMKFVLFGIAIYILSYYNFITETELAASNQKLRHQADELKMSNSDLEQYAAIISHDLKAPVSNVSSFMTLLMRKYASDLDTDALRLIELSKKSADRMSRQIADLLSYSRLGHDLPAAGAVDANMMIQMIQIEQGERIKDKNAVVLVEHSLPVIGHVHTSMIYHIFQNLITNGIKFNKSPIPVVRITCAETTDAYTFSVADNGIGIDPVYKDKLFYMFKRLHSEAEFEGTGIGLAVCKKIVDYYNGNIWFDSEIGKGTTIHFSLPKRKAEDTDMYAPNILSTLAPDLFSVN